MSVAYAVGNEARREHSAAQPGDRLDLGLGRRKARHDPVGVRDERAPGVGRGRIERGPRSTSATPASRSSVAICWDTAEGV